MAITDFTNEAKDNLKYLNAIEQLCRPLYQNDLKGMLEALPSLVNTIQMIHAVSRYYHTSERMTSLFVKVWYMHKHFIMQNQYLYMWYNYTV